MKSVHQDKNSFNLFACLLIISVIKLATQQPLLVPEIV